MRFVDHLGDELADIELEELENIELEELVELRHRLEVALELTKKAINQQLEEISDGQ